MVTYDQGSDRTGSDRQTSPAATQNAARPGRPLPGGALAKTRKSIRIVRLVLVSVAVVCGAFASASSETDVETSNQWTLVMAVAICLIPLGGLFWWVEPQPTERLRRWQRRRTVGRWLCALVATGGSVLFFVAVFIDMDERIWIFGFVCFLFSPVIALVFGAGGPSRTESRPSSRGVSGVAQRFREKARSAVDQFCTVLVARGDPASSRLPRSATIRPRAPLGLPVPARLQAWLEHGQLSTDGSSISVTDAIGDIHTRPLAGTGAGAGAGENADGVATLLVRREPATSAEQRKPSAPISRRHLSLLDTQDRRLLDLELYGWTRAELIEFARASGLELRDYDPIRPGRNRRGGASGAMDGSSPGYLEAAYPRAPGYARAAGGSEVGDNLLTSGLVLAILAVAVAAMFFGSWANGQWLDPDSGWAGIARVGWMLLVTIPGSALATYAYTRLHRRRDSVPEPSDAI